MLLEGAQAVGRILFYVGLPCAALAYPRWFIYWLLVAPACGLWVEYFNLGVGSSHLQSYVETTLACWFMIAWLLRSKKGGLSLYLVVLPLLAIPSFLNASGHVLFSIFFFVGLLAGPGVYAHFLDQIPTLIEKRHIDRVLLIWNILALAVKLYEATTLGGSFLMMRGGGIWSSNHYGGIVLLLLPMVRSNWIVLMTLAVMMLQLSRGIYLSLIVFGLAWALWVNWRPVVRIVGAIAVSAAALWIVLPASQKASVEFMVVERFASEEMSLRDVDLRVVIDRLRRDERLSLQRTALQMATDSAYGGVGLGGFYFGMEAMGKEILYSNAHNLYLTALAEGGAAYMLGLCALIAYGLWCAWRFNRRAFAGLLAWSVYGLYSGEVYEAARFASCMDYYFFLLLLAWVGDSARRSSGEQALPQRAPSQRDFGDTLDRVVGTCSATPGVLTPSVGAPRVR